MSEALSTDERPVSTLEWIDLYDRPPTKDDANSEGDVIVWWTSGESTREPWDQMPPGGTEYPSHWARFPCREES